MNLILFTRSDLETGLADDDPRIVHIRDVLKFGAGDWFDMGLIDGPRGKARIADSKDGRTELEFALGDDPPDLYPITMLVGMPRPQTARRLLRELTSLGVERIWFAVTDRSDKGYAGSKLWATGEYERHLRHGAEQAFTTRIPEVRRFESILDAVDALPADVANRAALDNYEADLRLSEWIPEFQGTTLALGAERGWAAAERDLLRASGFKLVGLGERVLRVETAATAAVSQLLTSWRVW